MSQKKYIPLLLFVLLTVFLPLHEHRAHAVAGLGPNLLGVSTPATFLSQVRHFGSMPRRQVTPTAPGTTPRAMGIRLPWRLARTRR